MRIGIGLPNTTAGLSPALVINWATQADKGPFSTLGVFDRQVYDSYEPLITLDAAVAGTQRN